MRVYGRVSERARAVLFNKPQTLINYANNLWIQSEANKKFNKLKIMCVHL